MECPSGVAEYLAALTTSAKFGPQVVYRHCLPAEPGQWTNGLPGEFSPILKAYLQQQGVDRLYSHQDEAIQAIAAGEDILVATPTASGKSMIYNLPVVNTLAQSEAGCALYLFPLKALAQDQLRVLRRLLALLPGVSEKDVQRLAAIFDGDTSPYQRRRIRETMPRILLTNPEMLHLSLLPYHGNWAAFWQNLKYVVVDEVHTYRGIFGANIAWVFRRLQRVAAYYGSNPQFIMLSATVGNPATLGEKLLNRPVRVITRSGAPRAAKHVLLLNPWDSAAYTASQLLEAAVKRELRTIVYTQSRKMTELINLWTAPRLGDKADKLSSYRAGFLPEERREIEQKLAAGDLLGVISTSALELGIDIGNLDLCILVGYPGSIMAVWQRGGRVGRSGQDSAIIMIAQEDALDQYLMRQPEQFLQRPVESAVLNPYNSAIMAQHLHCAAAELPIRAGEPLGQDPSVEEALVSLTAQALLLAAENGQAWYASRKYPHRQVSLRGGGSQLAIINRESGEILGEIDSGRALHECHPGAIYIHRARIWLVESLDLNSREATVTSSRPAYFTRPMISKNTAILETLSVDRCGRSRISFGRLRVTEQVTGYQKRQSSTQKLIATIALDLPAQQIETTGLWLDIPAAIKEGMEKEQRHFMGAIHALEHGMIALFPLLVLCDRNDIGGISCPEHEQTGEASIFIYDGHTGGVGLAEEACSRIAELLGQTEHMIRQCPCDNGCPSCVHSPKCGSGNRPIDKSACLRLLELLRGTALVEDFPLDGRRVQAQSEGIIASLPEPNRPGAAEQAQLPPVGLEILPPRYGVFDLETIRSAAEVGGWHLAARMGMSVGIIYDSQLDDCVTYLEHETAAMIRHLQELDLVVGFNNRRFDYQVLSGYSGDNLNLLPTLDLLEEVSNILGYRLSLDRLAEHTLGVKKTADGLQALQWYKEGKIDLIRRYCRKDVEITRDIFHFALQNGYLLFQNKAGKIVRLPFDLRRAIVAAVKLR